MLFVARPLFARFPQRGSKRQSAGAVAVCVVALVASAWIADRIGIHAILGSFLLGAVMPHQGPVARFFTSRVWKPVTLFLMPAFFAFVGMRTRIDLMSGFEDWAICGLIIVMATAGKVGGVYAAARATGMAQRPAIALGALMNTRGLMELIVLNMGLELGVISPRLFSMMVLMAIVTTLSTAPALRMFLGDAERARGPLSPGPDQAVDQVLGKTL
jgi:Kef-type K+ transport system membrane component KefB